MSQNAHSLLLFFDDELRHKHCLLMLLKLTSGDDTQAHNWAQRLGVDLREEWHEHWFNHGVSAQPEYVRLDYETSTHYNLPLQPLLQLFASGLKAAVLEVFHDQVGESSRYHFLDNQLVNRDDLYAARPQVADVVATQLDQRDEEDEADYDEDDDYSVTTDQPVTLQALIKQEHSRERDAQDMVKSILELSKVARETGSNPIEVVKSALILRALGVGLLQALVFTVGTVLLFKGLWLWIGLGVLLAVALPIYHAMGVLKEFGDDEEDDCDAD